MKYKHKNRVLIVNTNAIIYYIFLSMLILSIKKLYAFPVNNKNVNNLELVHAFNDDISNFTLSHTHVVNTNDGGILTVGMIRPKGAGDSDIYLFKCIGDELKWSYVYGSKGYEDVFCIISTKDEGFLIGGSTTGYGAYLEDYYLLKIDSKGQVEWHTVFGSVNSEWITNLIEIENVGYLLEGKVLVLSDSRICDPGYYYMSTMLVNFNGSLLWQRNSYT
jgi:hypothetical protein